MVKRNLTMSKREKKEEKRESKYQKKRTTAGRAEGDAWVYYFLHFFIGALFFLPISIYFGFFSIQSGYVADLFTLDFLYVILTIFAVSLGINILARVLAYRVLKKMYKNSEIKTIWELNSKKMNKLGVRWIIATFIASLLFATGIVVIIQGSLLATIESEIVALILTYFIIKFSILIFTKIFINVKG